MSKKPASTAADLDVESRRINELDWEPVPGMAKKRCDRCGYWFAVPIAKAEAADHCPTCAGLGTRRPRKG